QRSFFCDLARRTPTLTLCPYTTLFRSLGYRNSYRAREMKTRVGTLELRVPRVRSGSFSTELFERYQRSEQALLLAMMEMVINGRSEEHTSELQSRENLVCRLLLEKTK